VVAARVVGVERVEKGWQVVPGPQDRWDCYLDFELAVVEVVEKRGVRVSYYCQHFQLCRLFQYGR